MKYHQIENALNKEQIDEIVSFGDNLKNWPGVTGGEWSSKKIRSVKQTRIKLNATKWLREFIYELAEKGKSIIETENKISIDISGGIEKRDENEFGLYCTYDKSDHYVWHKDASPHSLIREGRTRTLSLTIQLSESKDYKEGELLLKPCKTEVITASKEQGSAIFFVSDMLHKVAPIIEGTRKSLIFWFHRK